MRYYFPRDERIPELEGLCDEYRRVSEERSGRIQAVQVEVAQRKIAKVRGDEEFVRRLKELSSNS